MSRYDTLQPITFRDSVQAAITTVLAPWISQADIDLSSLPVIKMKELTRRTGLKTRKVKDILAGDKPLTFKVGKSMVIAYLSEDFESFTFKQFEETKSKYSSSSVSESDWIFLSQIPGLPERKMPQIIETVDYFDKREFKGKPIPNRNTLLAKLANLAKGIPEMFPIYNCFIFDWEQRGNKYPVTRIDTRIEYTPAVYHKATIIDTARRLSSLGPAMTVLTIPDSEVFDSQLWEFQQSEEERKNIVKQFGTNLTEEFSEVKKDKDIDFQIMAWSELLSAFGQPSASQYTDVAEWTIQQDPDLMNEIETKGLEELRLYFEGYGIDIRKIDKQELIQKHERYKAMYFGEGVGLIDLEAVLLNVEDFRVTNWTQKGARGQLSILTPTPDVYKYYSWRKNKLGSSGQYGA